MSHDERAGVGYMVLGIASLSFMDALGKRVAAHYSVFEMLAIRSTVALVLILLFLLATRRLDALRTRQPWGHALRALCGLVAFVCFYASLRHLPLADAVAIAFASPFLITALGRFVLKEPVTVRQWLAIAAGFAGMLVIVRPGASGFHPAALLVVVCAVAYAALMVLTRWMTRPHRPAETTSAFVFYMLAGQAVVGWLVAVTRWRTPDGGALAEMAGMGVLGILGNYGLAQAFRMAPVATVAPFEYTGLIWAVGLGAVLFGDVPTPSFWVGAVIIVWAGIYAVRSSPRPGARGYDEVMIQVRPAGDRGRTDWGWLDSRHTFSFGEYNDPSHMGFRALRVINDDRVEAGAGFGTHGHRDMEILSYVLEGALAHKDSSGGGGVIRPGEIQFMRAGTGVTHSEYNHSKTEPVHFLQVWIVPDKTGLKPAYGQRSFDRDQARRGFVLLASRDGGQGSLQVQQDVDLWVTLLERGERRAFALRPGRHAWVHVARGSVSVNGVALREGDGAALSKEDGFTLVGQEPAEVLVFDLG